MASVSLCALIVRVVHLVKTIYRSAGVQTSLSSLATATVHDHDPVVSYRQRDIKHVINYQLLVLISKRGIPFSKQ